MTDMSKTKIKQNGRYVVRASSGGLKIKDIDYVKDGYEQTSTVLEQGLRIMDGDAEGEYLTYTFFLDTDDEKFEKGLDDLEFFGISFPEGTWDKPAFSGEEVTVRSYSSKLEKDPDVKYANFQAYPVRQKPPTIDVHQDTLSYLNNRLRRKSGGAPPPNRYSGQF